MAKIEVFQTPAGIAITINNLRVAGPKITTGSTLIRMFDVEDDKLTTAINENDLVETIK